MSYFAYVGYRDSLGLKHLNLKASSFVNKIKHFKGRHDYFCVLPAALLVLMGKIG